MDEDGDELATFRWIAGAMSGAQRLRWQRVLVALLRLHTDAYVIEWLCEHQALTSDVRAEREAALLDDYALIE